MLLGRGVRLPSYSTIMTKLDLTKKLKAGDIVYSPLFGRVGRVYKVGRYITVAFNKRGQYPRNFTKGECMLFPSKERT